MRQGSPAKNGPQEQPSRGLGFGLCSIRYRSRLVPKVVHGENTVCPDKRQLPGDVGEPRVERGAGDAPATVGYKLVEDVCRASGLAGDGVALVQHLIVSWFEVFR